MERRETELERQLRGVLERRYHHLHPFNQAMHRGELSRQQIRAWIANRFYYQQNIPVKDALLLAKLPREYRRVWIGRIHTHDGQSEGEGGLEAWLALGEAAGLAREALLDNRDVLPGVRFAVDAYVGFVRDKPWLEGVASSLTELFAPSIMTDRTAAFETHYAWLAPEGLQYFRNRLRQAPKEADHALAIVLEHATTSELEERVVAALRFKCEVLWALLDAVMIAYPE
jgi:pyrroloquinoline-quinone synthase